MLNYTKILAEQLGFPEDKLALLAGLGGFVGGLRPTQKALICVGAATVACMLVGLTVKSMKKRGNKNLKGNGNGNADDDDDATVSKRKRMSINIGSGSQLNLDMPPQVQDDTITIKSK